MGRRQALPALNQKVRLGSMERGAQPELLRLRSRYRVNAKPTPVSQAPVETAALDEKQLRVIGLG